MFSGPEVIKENRLKDLRIETNGCAIIDSGCATNVCGEAWLENYKESLTSDDKRKITEEPSNQKFTFGIGGTAQAKLRVRVPCWLNGKSGFLMTDVIENDIPLLLSRESLRRMHKILDFGANTLSSSTGNTIVELKNTSSGHYALPLSL